VEWFARRRPSLVRNVFTLDVPGVSRRRMLSLVSPERLRRVLTRVFDETEFLSPYGVRSMSAAHRDDPVRVELDGVEHVVGYEPGDSQSAMFGGNSNWRGPVWTPVNFLLIEALQRYHYYLGDDFTIEFPTGSGNHVTLAGAADALSRRVVCPLRAGGGRRPINGDDPRLSGEAWQGDPWFPEFFHGDTGRGLGASHQTGWTALVAKLIRQMGPDL